MPPALLIRDALVDLPSGRSRVDILCEGPRIAAIGPALDAPGAVPFEANGLLAGPGFVDIHVHGGGGHSFFGHDPRAVRLYAAWAPRHGVTSFLVSTLGRTPAETCAIVESLSPAIGCPGAEPLGFHLEGPFINPVRRGAFPVEMLRPPDAAEFESYQSAARGHIRQVTLAPELPGALDLAAAVVRSGAVAAMGHTDATLAEARAGFAAGINHVTHLYNAMRPLHQREGGPLAAALLDATVTCELICDGAHVAPEVLQLAYRLLGPRRAVIVTDNLHLAGEPASSGSFGGQPIEVSGARAVRADGTIVGSVATMDQHVRNAVAFLGIDAATAFRLASANPARVAGAGKRKGRLAPGFDADIVLLDERLSVAATICRGEVAFGARPLP